jgi:L-threonylcarbamoyladenylate synthase
MDDGEGAVEGTIDPIQQTTQAAQAVTVSTNPHIIRAPRSPGMKYKHYAPRGMMTLVLGDETTVSAYILQRVAQAKKQHLRVGILAFTETAEAYPAEDTLVLGERFDLTMAAQHLYAALREMDDRGVQRIFAEGVDAIGLGQALMNRLTKAAGNRIIRV